MTEQFEQVLKVGGKANSLGRASEVVESILADPSQLDELFQCIDAEDAWVRMRAIDSFEKIIKANPEWVKPYLDRIFNELTQSTQPSIQWHLAQIFTEVEMSNTQRDQAINWLKDRIKTTDVDWIVSADAMKALMHFKQLGFVSANDLKLLLNIQQNHTSNSVRKKATRLLEEIETQ